MDEFAIMTEQSFPIPDYWGSSLVIGPFSLINYLQFTVLKEPNKEAENGQFKKFGQKVALNNLAAR